LKNIGLAIDKIGGIKMFLRVYWWIPLLGAIAVIIIGGFIVGWINKVCKWKSDDEIKVGN
jgi:ABC-type Mn2+/Zn2+ transport system permease subunit